ncbi:hypothetical protein C8F01DRAFT_1365125, partial [Mycena amicta]
MLRAARTCKRRNTANLRWISSYPSKVRAFPFKFSPEAAIAQISATDAIVGATYDVQEAFQQLFGKRGLLPEKIVPVYFPAWLVDAEIEALATVPATSGSMEGIVTATFVNSYLPGHRMDKLSMTSLLSELSLEDAIPFSTELQHQFDTNVTCLPFQTTPFPILDAAKRFPSDDFRIDDFHINPSSIRPNLIAAYPILLPLYLARYKFFQIYKTVVVEAHTDEARIGIERVRWSATAPSPTSPFSASGETWMRRFVSWMEQGTEDAPGKHSKYFWYPQGSPASFSNLASLIIPPEWTQRTQSLVIPDWGAWLATNLTPQSLQGLVTADHNMEDPRIRPFTPEELGDVRNFMRLGEERAKAYAVLESVSRETTGDTKQTLQQVREHAMSSDRSRQEATPSWWTDSQYSQ